MDNYGPPISYETLHELLASGMLGETAVRDCEGDGVHAEYELGSFAPFHLPIDNPYYAAKAKADETGENWWPHFGKVTPKDWAGGPDSVLFASGRILGGAWTWDNSERNDPIVAYLRKQPEAERPSDALVERAFGYIRNRAACGDDPAASAILAELEPPKVDPLVKEVTARIVREFRPEGWPAKEAEIARLLDRHFVRRPLPHGENPMMSEQPPADTGPLVASDQEPGPSALATKPLYDFHRPTKPGAPEVAYLTLVIFRAGFADDEDEELVLNKWNEWQDYRHKYIRSAKRVLQALGGDGSVLAALRAKDTDHD